MNLYTKLVKYVPESGWRRILLQGHQKLGYITKGSIPMQLFLPHLVMSWGMMCVGLLAVLAWPLGMKVGDMHPAMGLLLIPFGGVFAIILTPIILGRRTAVIDLSRNELVESVGLRLLFLPMIPVAWQRVPLDKFTRLELNSESRSTKNGSYTVFVVRLITGSNTHHILVETGNVLSARNTAEGAAKFIQIPLTDTSLGSEPVTRMPDHLDEPLAEQAQRTGEAEKIVRPPGFLRGEYGTIGAERVVRMARPPYRGGTPLIALLACVVLYGLSAYFMPEKPVKPEWLPPVEETTQPVHEPSLWPYRLTLFSHWVLYHTRWLSVIAGILAVMIFICMEVGRDAGYEIFCGENGLRIHSRWCGVTRRHEFSSKELEELRVDVSTKENTRLIAVSDRKIVYFSDHITEREARYLRSELIRALSSTKIT